MAEEAQALQPGLLDLLQEMTERLQAHKNQIAGAPPRASGLQPPVFHGSPTEDYDEWLQKFQRYATFNGWTPDQQLNGFVMFLSGSALCVYQRQTHKIRADLDALQDALRQVFVSPHQQFLRRQERNNRTQGPVEPLESYLDDVDARAARLQLTDAETMQCFVQGLRQDLKEHVILQLPDTYAAAVDAACLKNSLSRPSISVLPNQSSCALSAIDLGSSHVTAQTTRNTHTDAPNYVTRQEFMSLQNQLQSIPPNSQRIGPAQPPAISYYNSRNRRTTDGRPICNRCNKVGHIASRCFVNLDCPNFPQSRGNFNASRGPLSQPQNYLQGQNIWNNFPNNQSIRRPNPYAARPTRFPALPPPPPPPCMNVLLQDSAYTPNLSEPCFLFARKRSTLSDTVFHPDLRKTFYLTVSGKIGGIDANILIDTGSAITVINQDLWDKVRENSNSFCELQKDNIKQRKLQVEKLFRF